MRRVAFLALPLFLFGCQGSDAPTASEGASKVTEPVVEAPQAIPKDNEIALYNGDQSVTLGSLPRNAFEVFPGRDAVVDKKLPAGFAEPYGASHWEDGHDRGFGVITYNGRVVSAMYQENQATASRFDELVALHQKQLSKITPESFEGPRVRYRFWESGGVRLMICEFQGTDKGIKVTAALGVDNVMDALGASKEHAKESIRTIDATLQGHSSPPVKTP
ncbi:hypothetical protein [Fimbriimonas ginsengisoli]|uniref:Lipoprotein n=1 Tax=Fimbriimonas ginsengisoli Gsoil 348 TaxID=661478 RepID=A0A068NZ06_FIMGI|nr:hypothetical protein [Fimbriimonas ginsengisoli]AIE87739.1 hypothetical protein OP10G_4371 [Fimbriimonas ginsengisoli Gsoil 348]